MDKSNEIQRYNTEIELHHKRWKSNKRLYRYGAYSVSLITIFLGLFSAALALEEISIPNEKALIGISGLLIVAAQTIEERFKLKSREERYRSLQKRVEGLRSDLNLIPESFPDDDFNKELLKVRNELKNLIEEAAED